MTDKDLNDLYDIANVLIKKRQWSLIDNLLEFYATSAWRQDIDILLVWLTITLNVKDKLKNRSRLMNACQKFHTK